MAYASNIELRNRINKTSVTDDSVLTALIAAAGANIDRAVGMYRVGFEFFAAPSTASARVFSGSGCGVQFIDPEQVELWCHLLPVGQARGVKYGSPVFGPAADLIRSEALIALRPTPPAPTGIIALGSRAPHNFGDYHGNELLAFLG